jgi:hypothetical protein
MGRNKLFSLFTGRPKINKGAFLVSRLTGWAGLLITFYGIDYYMNESNPAGVPWFLVGALLLASSLWTELDSKIKSGKDFYDWIEEEHSQIREAQSINADTFHQDLNDRIADINDTMDDRFDRLADRVESDDRIANMRDNEVEEKIQSAERTLHARIDDIDRALGNLMRNCESRCSAKR